MPPFILLFFANYFGKQYFTGKCRNLLKKNFFQSIIKSCPDPRMGGRGQRKKPNRAPFGAVRSGTNSDADKSEGKYGEKKECF